MPLETTLVIILSWLSFLQHIYWKFITKQLIYCSVLQQFQNIDSTTYNLLINYTMDVLLAVDHTSLEFSPCCNLSMTWWIWADDDMNYINCYILKQTILNFSSEHKQGGRLKLSKNVSK